jgi:hypothetical protein
MKEIINEHDMTKKMMNVIRSGNKKLINEFKEPITGPDTKPIPDDQKDTIAPKEGDSLFDNALTSLQSTIGMTINITNFKLYPKDNDVLLEGTIQKKTNEEKISFTMTLKSRVKIDIPQLLTLDNDTVEVLKKLNGFYDVWEENWVNEIKNYKTRND